MATLSRLEALLNTLLQPEQFNDYCPNGLQVEGRSEIHRLVTGVTACQALIDQAIAQQADAVLVHHGFFWRGENPCLTGIKRKRIVALLQNNISLLAYHLPLDAHLDLGNNACLGRLLGLEQIIPGDAGQLVWQGRSTNPLNAEHFHQLLVSRLSHQGVADVLHIGGQADVIQRVAWCTGAAQGYIERAADMGVDAYVSGEVSEQTVHVARERGIHYFAAGHHATERYGVQAVGEYVAAELGLEHQFIDIANPV